MGHLGFLRQEYRELVHRLDAGQVGMPEPSEERARAGWQEILEILYTPEEAALASRLPVRPARLATIAGRTGLASDDLARRLDRMADKGLVLDLIHPESGETRYLLAPPVVGFFEFSLMRLHDELPKARLAEAYDAYLWGDETFAREVFGGDTVIGRTLVHETTLVEEEMPEVLDWQRATAVIEEARQVAVTHCYCRHKAEHLGKSCDAPMEVCLSLDSGAEFIVRRGFGRAIDNMEGLEILAAAREGGLVQIADNVRRQPSWICNCCGCCCAQLSAVREFDLPAVTPSGFVPIVDLEACVGCSRCARACPVGAITMAPCRSTGKSTNALLPEIDGDRCIGCGVCADACRKESMGMERGPETPYVPDSTLERVIRMALERGKLPHLLVDAGAGRGSRFMNRLLQAICALPPAERLLASEQLKSRFVRHALRSIPDPTGTPRPQA